jgi:hypothetical protein
MAELPADDAQIRLYQATLGVIRFMGNFWTQRTQAQANCTVCIYSPIVIDYYLRNWEELVAAAYGTSASGGSLLGGGGESGRGRWVATKADIESATDKALVNGTYLKWHAVRRIYVKQERLSMYEAFLQLHRWNATGPDMTAPEPRRAGADAICRELIALRLGWVPHECEDAA